MYLKFRISLVTELPTLKYVCVLVKRGRRKIAQNSIEVDAKTKESMRKMEEKLDGRNKEGHASKKPK